MASTRVLSKTKITMDLKRRRYTSHLQKGGASISDMRHLVRIWSDNISWGKQRELLIQENILGKKSRARSIDVYQELFVPRFLKGDPPEAWKIMKPLEMREAHLDILKPLYYWITARSESILYDFVTDEILGRSKSFDKFISVKETINWIEHKVSKQGLSWSEAVTIRVAQGMLAALRDFGILEGKAKKKIAPIYIPIESFAYIAFALYSLGNTGEKLVVHPDWKLFLLQSPVVERLFLDAHQSKLLCYEAAGKIYRIEFYAHNMEDMANVVARRQP